MSVLSYQAFIVSILDIQSVEKGFSGNNCGRARVRTSCLKRLVDDLATEVHSVNSNDGSCWKNILLL